MRAAEPSPPLQEEDAVDSAYRGGGAGGDPEERGQGQRQRPSVLQLVGECIALNKLMVSFGLTVVLLLMAVANLALEAMDAAAQSDISNQTYSKRQWLGVAVSKLAAVAAAAAGGGSGSAVNATAAHQLLQSLLARAAGPRNGPHLGGDAHSPEEEDPDWWTE